MSIVSIYSFMVLTLKRTSTHLYKKIARLGIFSLYISVNGQDEAVHILCFHDMMLKRYKVSYGQKTILMAGRFSCVQVIYYSFHNALEFLVLYKRGLVYFHRAIRKFELWQYHILQKIVVDNFNLTMYVFTTFVVVILLSIHQFHLNLMARKKIDYSYKRISIESIKNLFFFSTTYKKNIFIAPSYSQRYMSSCLWKQT